MGNHHYEEYFLMPQELEVLKDELFSLHDDVRIGLPLLH